MRRVKIVGHGHIDVYAGDEVDGARGSVELNIREVTLNPAYLHTHEVQELQKALTDAAAGGAVLNPAPARHTVEITTNKDDIEYLQSFIRGNLPFQAGHEIKVVLDGETVRER